jgi:DNA-binding CsgD family transcriptional regulator
MTAQRPVHNVSGPKEREAKLLFVGRDDEFEDNVTLGILDATKPWVTSRSASLLGALARLQSQHIDFVLLSHKFRDEELDLFVADARQKGFRGLILRVATMKSAGSDSSGDSPSGFPPPRELMDDPMHPMRVAQSVRRQGEGSNRSLSFTPRQRAVLTLVSDGMTNQQVARQLNCSEGAVKAILQELFRKLEVRKRSQIVRVVFEKGLIDIPRKAGWPSYQAGATDEPLLLEATVPSREPLDVGDFIIDVAMHRVWVRRVETHLTPSEFQLLWIFATHPGKLIRGSSLRELFWRNPTARQSDLRVLVGTLRAKIEVSKTPRYVVTERYLGYRFIPSPS